MSQLRVESSDRPDRPVRRRFHISVDWAALLVALVIAAAVRLGVIARIPW
jgi:hypothetical protein